MFCGRLKTLDPTIEPMTSAVSAPSRSLRPPVVALAVDAGAPKSVVTI
jgi:hypothetical protein